MKEIERKRLRLRGHDYKNPGLYYVTLCAQNRKCIFGGISNTKVLLNDAGKMLYDALKNIEDLYPIVLDEFIIMPNHVHAIIIITGRNNVIDGRDIIDGRHSGRPLQISLSDIIKLCRPYLICVSIGVHGSFHIRCRPY